MEAERHEQSIQVLVAGRIEPWQAGRFECVLEQQRDRIAADASPPSFRKQHQAEFRTALRSKQSDQPEGHRALHGFDRPCAVARDCRPVMSYDALELRIRGVDVERRSDGAHDVRRGVKRAVEAAIDRRKKA